MTSRAQHPGPRRQRARGVPSSDPKARGARAKAPAGRACGDCGLVQRAGRWQWPESAEPKGAGGLCPSCQRVRDGRPAGTLVLPAALVTDRDELVQRIHNLAAAEQTEHPLERLMGIAQRGGDLVVTTTGVHLARQLAHKLAKGFHRKARLSYADGEELVEVTWDEG